MALWDGTVIYISLETGLLLELETYATDRHVVESCGTSPPYTIQLVCNHPSSTDIVVYWRNTCSSSKQERLQTYIE